MPSPVEKAAAGAEGGKQVEDDAEDVEQEDAGDEGRRADAEDAEHDDEAVEPRAASKGGERSQRDAEAEDDGGAV